MSSHKRDAKQQIKASKRRRLKVHERLARDRRQAQHAAEALHQALDDLGLPEGLVTEIEGRLRSQQQLLGKIVSMMFPRRVKKSERLFFPAVMRLLCLILCLAFRHALVHTPLL